MKTIYKYPLKLTDDQELRLPVGAMILTVQIQNEAPVLWALVDSTEPLESRFIEIIGTGNPVTGMDSRIYISTFQLNDGRLVFHVFEYAGA